MSNILINTQKQTWFLIVTFRAALSHLVIWHQKLIPLKRQTKAPGSVFALSGVKEKHSGPGEGILCQACSAALTQSSPLAPSSSLSLLSFPTRAETSKRTVPWCASNKSSLLNFILLWICVWITLELQIKICWTLRVRSCGIDHRGFQRSLLVWEKGTGGCYFDWWL